MIYVYKYLNSKLITFVHSEDKNEVLNTLIDLISSSPNILDEVKFRKAVFDRESILSTGIGLGIAIPHVKIKEVKDITIAMGLSKRGIAWDGIDNKPVHIVFLIAGSSDQHEHYLRILSKIILVLKKKDRRQKLIEAKDTESVLKLFEDL